MAVVIAGKTDQKGFSGDDRPATSALLCRPCGMAISDDAIYVADTQNSRVRKIEAETISTIAGKGAGYSGDGAAATEAELHGPHGIAIDGGKLYICDGVNNCIRAVDIASGIIAAVAGCGKEGFAGDGGDATAAKFYRPLGIAVAGDEMYVADSGNSRVRKISGGTISTIVGTGNKGFTPGGGKGTEVDLHTPQGLTLDGTNLYICDSGNHTVLKCDLGSGEVEVIGGTGSEGNGEEGVAKETALWRPWGCCVNDGALYVADRMNHKVRKIDLSDGNMSTAAQGEEVEWPMAVGFKDGSLIVVSAGNHTVVRCS